MKRKQLISKIAKAAKASGKELVIVRDSGGHTVFAIGAKRFTIPRHTEIGEGLTEAILRQVADELGKGWWRQ